MKPDDLPAALIDLGHELAGSEMGELMSLAHRLRLAADDTATLYALVERPCHDTWVAAQTVRLAPAVVLWGALNSYGGYPHRNGPRYASGTFHPEWPDQMCPTSKQVLRTLRRLAKNA